MFPTRWLRYPRPRATAAGSLVSGSGAEASPVIVSTMNLASSLESQEGLGALVTFSSLRPDEALAPWQSVPKESAADLVVSLQVELFSDCL
jgi:hypothetical protein